MSESIVELQHSDEARELFGPRDENLRRLCSATGATVVLRGTQVRISGDEQQVRECLETLHRWREILQRPHAGFPADESAALPKTGPLDGSRLEPDARSQDLIQGAFMIHSETATNGRHSATSSSHTSSESTTSRYGSEMRSGNGSPRDRVGQIRPKTDGQRDYMDAMRKHELVFCDGPAGSGKTYLAVALALEALRAEHVRKIVLVRPAVEAGEKLGFLPGDMLAKVNPFLRPLLDAIHDMLDHEQVRRYLANDVIEIVPLAFMRGRTLNDTFMILDEGQNTTSTQMKMFLTRMGTNSRIVVTGDSTQIDLEKGVLSGLSDALRRLSRISGVAIVRLTGQDIVRHRLVREIVSAYEADSSQTAT